MINKDNAEHYRWGGNCDGWHLLKSDHLSVIQERMPPGGKEVMHYHETSHQFFYVLRGCMTMVLADGPVRLQAGDGLSIAPGTPHQASNTDDTDVEFLVVSSPRSHGDRVTVEG